MTEQAVYKKMYKLMVNSDYKPFLLDNAELANQLCAAAKKKYPSVKVFSYGMHNYICLTEQACKYLLQYQQEHVQALQKNLEYTQALIQCLQLQLFDK